MKTGVAIIGAGPAGLLLGHLLRADGIECVVVERKSRAHVESRIRAGVLETVTTDLLHRLGIDEGLNARGLREEEFNLATAERLIRIDITRLTGRHVTVYGQTELTRDLIAAAPARGLEILFESTNLESRMSIAALRRSASCGMAGRSKSKHNSPPAATASTGRPEGRCALARSANMSVNIGSAGSAFWPMCRPAMTSSSI